MYETYVPIRVERRPPTIAEIVRQKTDDGARIVDFFLDVMEGRVDGAMLCHRIDAAKQLVKYGSKKAADFIAEHGDETCDHCESRKRGPAKPRPRKDASQAAGPLNAGPPHAPGPYGYDFLTLLTEDFLTVLSAVDEDLMIMLLRAQTRDGGTVIDFLDAVMHGREDGFRVNHRISAARELISHILRDEHRSYTSVVPANKIVVPAKAGTQRGGEGRSEPADEPTPGIVEESKTVRPELVEEPAPYSIRGQCSGDSAVPGPAANEADLTVVPAEAGFLPHELSPTHSRARKASSEAGCPEPAEGSQLETKSSKPGPLHRRRRTRTQRCREDADRAAGQRIERKLVAHWHEPNPWDGPIDPIISGRSPPC